MNATQTSIFLAGFLLLGGCAHQAGQAPAGAAQRSLDDPPRLSESQPRNCQAMNSGTDMPGGDQPLTVTDCDMMAVGQAAERQQRQLESTWSDDMDSGNSPLSGGIPRLPTSSGPDLLRAQ